MGGITGKYPDTDTAVIGPVLLSTEWRQYTIDLRGKDLNYVYSGTFYSNRAGKASSKPYRGSTMADLERGRNSHLVLG